MSYRKSRAGARRASPKLTLLDFLAEGDSVESILQEYPQLTREDVLACVAYGAEAARERFISVAMSASP